MPRTPRTKLAKRSQSPYQKHASRNGTHAVYKQGARDAATGTEGHWWIPVEIPTHIAKAGKPKPRVEPPPKYTPRVRSQEEQIRASIAAMESQLQNKELNKLLAARAKLDKKIAERRSRKAVPLALRITDPVQGPSVPSTLTTLAPSLTFGKTRYIQAAKHVEPILTSTLTRLTPLANLSIEYPGFDVYYDIKFHQLMCDLEDLVDGLLERARSGRIVNRMWRYMERDCRNIGKVNLEGYERRQADIIRQIVDTKARFDYGLEEPAKDKPSTVEEDLLAIV
ncbi:hypothetical protein WOLCODRAFT_157423 [Wolfiporia cocos MD-104 SS10]|uniref:Uncharacterized protein n=1 Tax=Wolfiporia cocos (strain MD-104) TaxID=742152 RepID=A0A2H3J3B1_WOLCO|nr:hypothetical protein WOLCODRAFT_157423 [Wolfiporia cocos MD-104 SS10]